MKTTRVLAAFGALAVMVLATPAADAQTVRATPLAGEKLDSGLGDLPHYSKWEDRSGRRPMGNRVLGESLDDGLGELPHYSQWVDPSGRDPMGRTLAGRKLAAR
jgi:hypothetical protein